MAGIDFSCASSERWTDIDDSMSDGQVVFQTYSQREHRELVEKVFEEIPFLRERSKEDREKVVRYADSIQCGR
jgi:hypothetical protein